MAGDVTRHQCGADFACEEGTLLLVDGADVRALCVVENGQVDGCIKILLPSGCKIRGTITHRRANGRRQTRRGSERL